MNHLSWTVKRGGGRNGALGARLMKQRIIVWLLLPFVIVALLVIEMMDWF
jgi:hypothetical protein